MARTTGSRIRTGRLMSRETLKKLGEDLFEHTGIRIESILKQKPNRGQPPAERLPRGACARAAHSPPVSVVASPRQPPPSLEQKTADQTVGDPVGARTLLPGQYLQDLQNPSVNWCRGRGSNPHAPCGTQDFKSCASASSATPACERMLRERNHSSPTACLIAIIVRGARAVKLKSCEVPPCCNPPSPCFVSTAR
jgi:hypothetical protein